MKYKLIRSMAHNWTHSFMSGMNYVDDDHVREDMYRLARGRRGEKVVITWLPNCPEKDVELGLRVMKSLHYYRSALAAHLERHQIDPGAISEMRTELYVADNRRMYVRSYVLDDRGKEHLQFVWS